jgi:hypothetical protein
MTFCSSLPPEAEEAVGDESTPTQFPAHDHAGGVGIDEDEDC